MKSIKWGMVIVAVITLSSFVFYKPSRVLIPEVNGVQCATKSICIDDISRLQQAEAMMARAVIDIEESLGHLKNYPKAIFCSTQDCFESFGFKESTASAVGKSAIVIGPRGWESHYLKHELIHYWQAENIGVIRMLFVDDWFIEGMAYALSDDPRPVLQEPWQTYRTKFTDWYKSVERNNMSHAVKEFLQADTQ